MKYAVAHKITLNTYTSQWSKKFGNFCTGGQEDTLKFLFQTDDKTTSYTLCNCGLVLFSRHFSLPSLIILLASWPFKLNTHRAAAICLVLHWHHPLCRTPYLHPTIKIVYVTHLWTKWGRKTRWLPPQTKMKTGDYLIFNIFLLTIIWRIKSFPSLYTRNVHINQWANSDSIFN